MEDGRRPRSSAFLLLLGRSDNPALSASESFPAVAGANQIRNAGLSALPHVRPPCPANQRPDALENTSSSGGNNPDTLESGAYPELHTPPPICSVATETKGCIAGLRRVTSRAHRSRARRLMEGDTKGSFARDRWSREMIARTHCY